MQQSTPLSCLFFLRVVSYLVYHLFHQKTLLCPMLQKVHGRMGSRQITIPLGKKRPPIPFFRKHSLFLVFLGILLFFLFWLVKIRLYIREIEGIPTNISSLLNAPRFGSLLFSPRLYGVLSSWSPTKTTPRTPSPPCNKASKSIKKLYSKTRIGTTSSHPRPRQKKKWGVALLFGKTFPQKRH